MFWFLSKAKPRKKPARRNVVLRCERLEDRVLAAGNIIEAPVSLHSMVKPIPIHEVAQVRSYDWVAGLRPNHNETLLRVRRRSRRQGR